MTYDQKKLTELVIKAKGENRSIRQYAEDADVSPSIISRIISGNYKPGIKVLQKLTSPNANPQGGVTLKDLTLASGYTADIVAATGTVMGALLASVPILGGIAEGISYIRMIEGSEIKAKRMLDDFDLNQFEKKQKQFKILAGGIIRDLMTEKGVKWIAQKKEQQDENGFQEDVIDIDGNLIEEWRFTYWSRSFESKELPQVSLDDRLRILISHFILTSPAKEKKFSIVTNDIELYEHACNKKDNISFKGNLSVILVDTENVEVLGECNMIIYESDLDIISIL